MYNSIASYLNADETARVQAQLMELLSQEIWRYNRGQSSSIPTETAQSLLESILYAISARVDTLPEPAAALKTRNLNDLREEGIQLLERCVADSAALLEKVKSTRVQTELIAYNQTIDEGFEDFQSYDPRYGAQSGSIMIDYPLFHDDSSILGILYVKNYLTQLLRENLFCMQFSKNYIRSLLLTHGVRHHIDYREILQNIPELILEHIKDPVERQRLEDQLTAPLPDLTDLGATVLSK